MISTPAANKIKKLSIEFFTCVHIMLPFTSTNLDIKTSKRFMKIRLKQRINSSLAILDRILDEEPANNHILEGLGHLVS